MITSDIADQAHQLLHEQISEWPMLRGGYESLNSIHTRSIAFDGFEIKLQFNPGRIVSSTAQTDATSIANRKCFLCGANRPPEQRALAPFGLPYLVLCNPYPIFPQHFTVAHADHRPQQIHDNFDILLTLARDMQSQYVALYNGPRSGASAPDHMHFQAGTRGFMPIDDEYDRLKHPVAHNNTLEIFRSNGCLRSFIALESSDRQALVHAFGALNGLASADEPMMNIIVSYQSGRWRAMIFPRRKHRPSFYFAAGDEKILLSPAAVEMGGVCTLPIKRDFDRLTRDHVVQMYDEVCIAPNELDALCERAARIV